jgi:hypothetical protein
MIRDITVRTMSTQTLAVMRDEALESGDDRLFARIEVELAARAMIESVRKEIYEPKNQFERESYAAR